MRIGEDMVMSEKLKEGTMVVHEGNNFIVSSIINHQRPKMNAKGDKYYVKPEITVYKYHHGKVFKNTESYNGEDYEIIM